MNSINSLSKQQIASFLLKSFEYKMVPNIIDTNNEYFEFKFSPEVLELRIPADLDNYQTFNVICFSLIKQTLSDYLVDENDEEVYAALYPIVKAFNKQFQSMLCFNGGYFGESDGDRTRFN